MELGSKLLLWAHTVLSKDIMLVNLLAFKVRFLVNLLERDEY